MLCKRKQTPPYWWWCLPTLPATLVKKCNLRANKVPACEENRLMAKGGVTPAGISEQRAGNLWPWLCPSLITGEWPWGQNRKQMFSLASSWLLYLWPFNSWIPQTHTFPVIRPPPTHTQLGPPLWVPSLLPPAPPLLHKDTHPGPSFQRTDLFLFKELTPRCSRFLCPLLLGLWFKDLAALHSLEPQPPLIVTVGPANHGGGGKGGNKGILQTIPLQHMFVLPSQRPCLLPSIPHPVPWLSTPSPPSRPRSRAVMTTLRQRQEGRLGFKALLHFSPCGENFLSQLHSVCKGLELKEVTGWLGWLRVWLWISAQVSGSWAQAPHGAYVLGRMPAANSVSPSSTRAFARSISSSLARSLTTKSVVSVCFTEPGFPPELLEETEVPELGELVDFLSPMEYTGLFNPFRDTLPALGHIHRTYLTSTHYRKWRILRPKVRWAWHTPPFLVIV